MEAHEHHDPGYDDWFDEPEPPTETQGAANRAVYEDAEEVWVLPEEEDEHSGQREIHIAGRALTVTQVAIIGLSILAIFFAILAAVGVFSPGTTSAPPTVTPPVKHVTTNAQTLPGNTNPSAQAPSQTLSPNATGPQVKTLQQALIALGFDPGTPDGDYGAKTQAAVQKFQTSKGLQPDGVVGPQTLAALQSALSG
jgi:Putative peptidoglycan binding domain